MKNAAIENKIIGTIGDGPIVADKVTEEKGGPNNCSAEGLTIATDAKKAGSQGRPRQRASVRCSGAALGPDS